jgi:thiol-disulfide isomerase/thioredoxin
MKVILFALGILATDLTLVCGTHPEVVRIAGHIHARIGLELGLPMFRPINRCLVADTYNAVIPVPARYGEIQICVGRDSSGNQRAFALTFRPDSSISMSEVVLRCGALGDTLWGHHDFELLPSQSTVFPFECWIVPSRREFVYRWSESADDENVPGGVPTRMPSMIELDKVFPRIEVSMLDGGKRVPLTNRGRLCVLNWWWTHCPGCIEEMPGLNSLVSKYRGRVDFVAVSNDSKSDIVRFLKSRQFRYVQTLADSTASALLGKSAPRNIVVNANGIVVFDSSGGGSATCKAVEAAIRRELAR